MTLEELKSLSGIGKGIYSSTKSRSSAGSNISATGTEKARLQRQHDIQPGTPEWFQLWFSLPYLTGEKPLGPRRNRK